MATQLRQGDARRRSDTVSCNADKARYYGMESRRTEQPLGGRRRMMH